MKARFLRLLRGFSLLLLAGLGYAVFCSRTGLMLPCPFHLVTGLLCPGCGVTRMCLALLHLDLAAAWRFNPGLLLLSPLLAVLFFSMALRYVRTGERRPTSVQSAAAWGMAAYLLLYGVGRNLFPLQI
ncbi:DUF2752 domain-containing protein [Pseudoflavonifractor sp. HCP28S3_F10]|uniref:DUF2752 domain-containing protein n=1 Tax=Pseudoflavonifractor sp. HCP28S3_F10 TaxID=3438947 RepID=UPI003F897947